MLYEKIQAILNDTLIPDYKKPKKVFSILNLAARNEDKSLLPYLSQFEKFFIIERAAKDKNLLSCALMASNTTYIQALFNCEIYSCDKQDRQDIKTYLSQAVKLGKNKCFELIFNQYESKIDTKMLSALIMEGRNVKIAEFIINEKNYDIKAQYLSALKEKQLFRQKMSLLSLDEGNTLIQTLTQAFISHYINANDLQDEKENTSYQERRELIEKDELIYHNSSENVMESIITAIKFFENKDYINTRQVVETVFFKTFQASLKEEILKSNAKYSYNIESNLRAMQNLLPLFEKRMPKYLDSFKAISYELFPDKESMQMYLPFYEKNRLNHDIQTSESEKGLKKRLKI